MERFEQFEVWESNNGKWSLIGAFRDFDIANALAHRRSYRVRLTRAVYQDNQAVQQDVLTEIGATRQDE